jgi:hypothetical protein
MPRKPNKLETVSIRVSTTPQVQAHLGDLVDTGLYGKNVAEAVERLVSRRLEDLIKEGFIRRSTAPATRRGRVSKPTPPLLRD